MSSTQELLASLSDNAIRSATVVLVLSMLGYAAQWACTRERTALATSARKAQRKQVEATAIERELVGAGGPARAAAGDVAAATTAELSAIVEGVDSADRVERGARFARIGFNLFVLGAVVLFIGVALRGVAAGRVPWSNLYEFSTAGSAVVSLTYLVLRRRLKIDWLAFPLVCFLLVILGLATTVLYVPVAGLVPALQSYWLAVHVTAAVLGTSLFTVGAMVSVMQLLKDRAQRRGTADIGFLSKLPAASAIDTIAYRINAFAFPIWTFAMMAGAIWAQHAWGRFWSWDPKETWMFISWVCYAAYLHARATPGWRTRLPWISLFAYATILFNLVGVNIFITGLHSYAGV